MRRRLPDYFRKDAVGGLSHLLRMMARTGAMGDLEAFFSSLESRYGADHAAFVIRGLQILLPPDKEKWQKLEEFFPEAAEFNERESQRLLSSLIYAASLPLVANDDLAPLLFTGERSRAKALDYMKGFLQGAAESATIVTPIDFPRNVDALTKARIVAEAVKTVFRPFGRNMALAARELGILRTYLDDLLPCRDKDVDSAIRTLSASVRDFSRFADSLAWAEGNPEYLYLENATSLFDQWKAKNLPL